MVANAIEVQDVTKSFKMSKERPKSAKERVIRAGRIHYEEFHALRDISFEVAPGETLAVLGHNGSGKSTLLKCVAGTLRPTTGRIATRGRVAALLELGAGFHPDLTGRENIYLNGSILGFSKSQVDDIFDDIVDFSELEGFIDLQVKHYSSGMYARLGFAVAINVDPDILLIDEVLAVGDESFQRKCLDRVRVLQREGRTILLVTHATDIVRQICDRAVVFDHGRMVFEGQPGESVRAFRETLIARAAGHVPQLAEETDHSPPVIAVDPVTGELPVIDLSADLVPVADATVSIRHVHIEYPDNPDGDHILPGDPLELRIGYRATGLITDVAFAIEIFDEAGVRLMGTTTDVLGHPVHAVDKEGEVAFAFDHVPLMDGRYQLVVAIHSRDGGTIYDQREFEDHFQVMNPSRIRGTVYFPVKVQHLWTF